LIGASFVALSLFLIVATVISYAMSIEVVAQTIAVVIFRMKTDEENLLERKDEEELELENDDDWSFDSDSDSDDDEDEDDASDSDDSEENDEESESESDDEDSSKEN
jgi:phosphopantothenoylcysteine synthetase/decarboxylase